MVTLMRFVAASFFEGQSLLTTLFWCGPGNTGRQLERNVNPLRPKCPGPPQARKCEFAVSSDYQRIIIAKAFGNRIWDIPGYRRRGRAVDIPVTQPSNSIGDRPETSTSLGSSRGWD